MENHERTCPYCGAANLTEAAACAHCGRTLSDGIPEAGAGQFGGKRALTRLSWAFALALAASLGLAMQGPLGSGLGKVLVVLSLAGLVTQAYWTGMFGRRLLPPRAGLESAALWIVMMWGCVYFALFETLVVGTEQPGYPSMSALFPAVFAGSAIGLISLCRWRGVLLACLLFLVSFAVLNLDASPGPRWMGFVSGCVLWIILVLAFAAPGKAREADRAS